MMPPPDALLAASMAPISSVTAPDGFAEGSIVRLIVVAVVVGTQRPSSDSSISGDVDKRRVRFCGSAFSRKSSRTRRKN